jgi:hypothetical protein
MLRLVTHAACVCQAALDAVCSATSAAHLMAYNALLPAWNAAGATLQFCTKVMRLSDAAWTVRAPWTEHGFVSKAHRMVEHHATLLCHAVAD